MRITISCISGPDSQLLNLEVPGSMTVADLKALVAAELPTPEAGSTQYLYHNGVPLENADRTLDECRVKDDDMVVIHTAGAPRQQQQQHQPQQAGTRPHMQQRQQQQQGPGNSVDYDFETIRLSALGNPAMMEQLRETNPGLHEAVNDPGLFRERFLEMERERADAERARQREIQLLNEDPFNIENQRKIEELIRHEQVMENLQSALEHIPEAFGRVTMLYIPVEVNGTAVKAFVDSGAQNTIMSPSCAERCGIMRLIDTRYSGIAKGVGTAKILGRVHLAQIKIGNIFVACSFTVMEGKDVELLLGLDMLKRHQMVLDLGRGCLVFRDQEVRFLGESEIPKMFEEPTVEGPGGSRVGGRTGAIVEPPQNLPPQQDTPQRSAPQQQQQQQPTAQRYPDSHIAQLQGFGFSREEAIAALDATGGNLEMAASLLFN